MSKPEQIPGIVERPDQGASLRDRAVVNGAGQAVSAIRASVPSAAALLLLVACEPADIGSYCDEQDAEWQAEYRACVAGLPAFQPAGLWEENGRSACRNAAFYTSYRVCMDDPAQAMSAGTAETAPQAQGEARQRGPKDAPEPPSSSSSQTPHQGEQ